MAIFILISACISGGLKNERCLFNRKDKSSKKDLGLYLTKKEINPLCKFNGFPQSLGLYLTRRSPLFPSLSPSPLIIQMLLPPLLHILIPATPVTRILLGKDPVVLPFPQPLTRNGTGLLTITHSWIRNKWPPTIMTSLLCHLTSPLPRNLKWLISTSLSISPSTLLCPQMIFTKSTQMILP